MKSEKKFIKNLKKISLASDERARTRSAILSFMRENPLPKEAEARKTQRAPLRLFTVQRPFAIALAALLIVVLGGGVALAAEAALPGDLMYPVKIHVTEELRATLAGSLEDKAQWEVERLLRRFEEVEQLLAQGKLDVKKTALVSQNLINGSFAVKQKAAALQSRDKLEAAENVTSDFDAAVRAHTQLLPLLASEASRAPDLDVLIGSSGKTTGDSTAFQAERALPTFEKIEGPEKIEVTEKNEEHQT
ncbi:MAG: hypothetical protein HY460_01150, partial [Parcubacteria group bacterium]|nr:hypothetical protein [Parcubacteria group bacterium]